MHVRSGIPISKIEFGSLGGSAKISGHRPQGGKVGFCVVTRRERRAQGSKGSRSALPRPAIRPRTPAWPPSADQQANDDADGEEQPVVRRAGPEIGEQAAEKLGHLLAE